MTKINKNSKIELGCQTIRIVNLNQNNFKLTNIYIIRFCEKISDKVINKLCYIYNGRKYQIYLNSH